MATKLIADHLWPRITRLARQRVGAVAVAYCGQGAGKLLPLKPGSLLVVDASENAVRCGQTHPKTLLAFINGGVAVHSAKNLHAKVFVFGDTAVVGSANASGRSAGLLKEAAVLTDARGVANACRTFIEGLTGEEVTPERAHALAKLWKPPKIVGGGGRRAGSKRAPKKVVPTHEPLWVVRLEYEDYDDEDKKEAKAGRRKARALLRKSEQLDEFHFERSVLCERVRRGHLVLQLVEEGKTTFVTQAGHVLAVRRYRKGPKGTLNAMIHVALPRASRRKKYENAIGALGAYAKAIRKVKSARQIRDASAAHAILNLWRARARR